MEFVINVAPSPADRNDKTVDGQEIPCDVNGPTTIFIYRNALEQHLGDVSYFKVISGKLTEGQDLVNPENGNKERISAIYAVAGKKREKVSEMVAGDIGCTVKLKYAKSNQTLCAPGNETIVAPIVYPQAKFRTAIKAVDEKDEEKLGEILNKAAGEDPTYIVHYAKELKQTILSGQGEQHINILKWQINNIHKLDIEFMAPRISYRETITKVATASYRHKKQSGGAGQFGEVHLLLEPFVEGAPQNNRFKVDGKEMVLNIKGKVLALVAHILKSNGCPSQRKSLQHYHTLLICKGIFSWSLVSYVLCVQCSKLNGLPCKRIQHNRPEICTFCLCTNLRISLLSKRLITPYTQANKCNCKNQKFL